MDSTGSAGWLMVYLFILWFFIKFTNLKDQDLFRSAAAATKPYLLLYFDLSNCESGGMILVCCWTYHIAPTHSSMLHYPSSVRCFVGSGLQAYTGFYLCSVVATILYFYFYIIDFQFQTSPSPSSCPTTISSSPPSRKNIHCNGGIYYIKVVTS